MTVSDYIKGQFEDFGVRLSEASVVEITIKGKLTSSDEVTESNFDKVNRAIVKSIPKLLTMPQSISEGSMSISKAQRESIERYYRLQCKELGIKDELTQRPKVTFL